MKLEYLDATGGGKYPKASPKCLIRLSEFSEKERLELISDIENKMFDSNEVLELHALSYITAIGCKVTFHLAERDQCLVPSGPHNEFDSLLTPSAFADMLEIIRQVGDSYNWLTPGEYLDEPAFLISKRGTW